MSATDTSTTTPALTCHIIRPNETYTGRQGLSYFAGIAAETVGSQHLCMHLLRMPPGARAKAHLHAAHESAVYLISGEVEFLYGEQLEHHVVMHAGEFLYIPAGVPHLPFNTSDQEAVAVLARTDPNEQESVVLLPELDARIAAQTG